MNFDVRNYLNEVKEVNPKQYWGVSLAFVAAAVGFWIRYLTADELDYLHASDSYMIFRVSQHVAYEGVFPVLDFLRYFPYEMPGYALHLGAPVIPAFVYNIGPQFVFDSYLDFAVAFTPLMAAATIVVAYFLGKELWDTKAGVGSAFMVALIPAVMHRGSAGFFQKDQTGVFFMFLTLLFFTRAWKQSDWRNGILSGLALGIFTITWGGSSMTWLLLPLTVATVLLLNEDIEKLIAAYTPTVIIGGLLASAFNARRFWITDAYFLGNLAVLGILWARYLVEKLEIIDEKSLKFFTPGAYVFGGVIALLSPFYSTTVWNMVLTLVDRITTPSGAVIAGTVAENQPIEPMQLLTEMGYAASGREILPDSELLVNPVELLGMIFNPWTFAVIGFAFLTGSIIAMLKQKYLNPEENNIDTKEFYGYMTGALGGLVLVLVIITNVWSLLIMVPAAGSVLAGFAIANKLDIGSAHVTSEEWVLLLPFFWFVSNVLGMFSMSRLGFLAGFPVAMMAGFGFSKIWEKSSKLNTKKILNFKLGNSLMVVLAVVTVLLGTASSMYVTDNIQKSPGEEWYPTLDYLEEETDHGSSVLSWWDYGYWFQTLGERPAVADGGNHGYYTDEGALHKVPHPIADFLTANNPSDHSELLEKHSVDYIVLDHTMVNKYAAVSQISNRDNEEFESIQPVVSSNTVSSAIEREENLVFPIGDQANIIVPLEDSEGSIEITDAPSLQLPTGSERINCVITEEQRYHFSESPSSDFCLAVEPYSSLTEESFQPVRAGLVPEQISENTFVELYYRQGNDLDWVEKVDEGSSNTVHMWEVVDEP